MATKTIKFRLQADGTTTIADGADGIVLASASNGGEYPTTLSGITAGFSPNNDSSITVDPAGVAAPFNYGSLRLAAGSPARLVRIDRTAGTFLVRIQTYLPDGTYASSALRILDSDGTTALYTQSVGNRITDGLGAARQLNTDGTMVTVGTADAGQTITTTGSSFYVELSGAGSFASRLTYIEWDDGAGGAPAGNFTQFYLDQLTHAGLL